jgi:hypothetical protein
VASVQLSPGVKGKPAGRFNIASESPTLWFDRIVGVSAGHLPKHPCPARRAGFLARPEARAVLLFAITLI